MAIISLGTINKTLIPVLLGALVCFLNKFLNSYKETLLFKNATLTVICISSSRLLAIIPLLIFEPTLMQVPLHENIEI